MLLLNMRNMLELSELADALGRIVKLSVPEGIEKIAGLWFARNIST